MYPEQVLFEFWWPNGHYINNTEEKKTHENHEKSQNSCTSILESPCFGDLKKGKQRSRYLKIDPGGETLEGKSIKSFEN